MLAGWAGYSFRHLHKSLRQLTLRWVTCNSHPCLCCYGNSFAADLGTTCCPKLALGTFVPWTPISLRVSLLDPDSGLSSSFLCQCVFSSYLLQPFLNAIPYLLLISLWDSSTGPDICHNHIGRCRHYAIDPHPRSVLDSQLRRLRNRANSDLTSGP